MSWSSYKGAAAAYKTKSTGKYVKLKEDGDEIICVPIGNPAVQYSKKRGNDVVRATAEEVRAAIDAVKGQKGVQASAWATFMLTVWDLETKSVRLLQMSPGLFDVVVDAVNNMESLHQRGVLDHPDGVLQIRRNGKSGSAFWSATRLKDISPELRATVSREQEYDWREEDATPLTGAASKPAAKPSPTPAPAEQADEDIPF